MEVVEFLEPQAKSNQLRGTPEKEELLRLRTKFISNPNDQTFNDFIPGVDKIAASHPITAAFTLHHTAREISKDGQFKNGILTKFGEVLELVANQNYGDFSGNLAALGIAVIGAFEARALRDEKRLSACNEQIKKYQQLFAFEGNIEATVNVLTSLSAFSGRPALSLS